LDKNRVLYNKYSSFRNQYIDEENEKYRIKKKESEKKYSRYRKVYSSQDSFSEKGSNYYEDY
jgi:hypothetical protein